MKIKSLASLCKNSKNIVIMQKVNGNGEIRQYISDGQSLFPLDGVPTLTPDEVRVIFDITESDAKKYRIDVLPLPETLPIDDIYTRDREYLAEREKLNINYGGDSLLLFYSKGGNVFIDAQELAPLRDIFDAVEFYIRTTGDGHRYLVAKKGMFVVGLFMPVDWVINDDFCTRLERIARACCGQLNKESERG